MNLYEKEHINNKQIINLHYMLFSHYIDRM